MATVSAMLAFITIGFPAQRASTGKLFDKKSTVRVEHDRHQRTHAEMIAKQYNFLLVCSKMSNAISTALYLHLCHTVCIHTIGIANMKLLTQVHVTASVESLGMFES